MSKVKKSSAGVLAVLLALAFVALILVGIVGLSSDYPPGWVEGATIFLLLIIVVLVLLLFALAVDQAWEEGRAKRKVAAAASAAGVKAGISALKTLAENRNKNTGATGQGLSRADELRKWVQLKDDGLITHEEFEKAREELMRH